MTARNNKHNSNEQTSASEASGASKRTTYDRNSDLNSGHPEELLPNSRFVWNGVFRPPIGFSGSFSNGGGYRGRVHGDEGQQRAEAEREGCGGAGETSRLKGPSAGQMLMKAIDKESGKAGENDPRIRTSFVHPPIPNRSYDWAAWVDGQEEGATGRGRTESDAVAELLGLIPQAAPKYSLKTQLLIGAWIFLSIASGVALGFMKGCR